MKSLLAGLALMAATVALSGCYYYPAYSYARPVPTGGGDAYYGTGVTYDNSYYPSYYGYYGYPGYYGYYGCCWGPAVSIGIGGVWYGGSHYYGHGGYYHGNGGYYRGGGGYYHGGGGGGHGGWGGHGGSGGHGGWSGHGGGH